MLSLPVLMDYVSNGLVLIPIQPGEKFPRHNGWNLPDAGIRRVEDLFDLDVDTYNWGLHHLASRTCALDIDSLAATEKEFTAHGLDIHTYLNRDLRIESGKTDHAKLIYRMPVYCDALASYAAKYATDTGKRQASFNFRCANRTLDKTTQDVLPPSIHPETKAPYRWVNGTVHDLQVIPTELLNFWIALLDRPAPATEKPIPTTASVIKHMHDALAYVSPDVDRDKWVEVGMAIHSVVGDGGFDAFHDWSARGSKYAGMHDVAAVWRSINDHPSGITVRTLYKYAIEGGWPAVAHFDELAESWQKETEAEGASAKMGVSSGEGSEKVLITALLREFEALLPISDADLERMPQVQAILLRAEQLRNPVNQDRIHNEVKKALGWSNATLNRHVRFLQQNSNAVLAGTRPNFAHLTKEGLPRDHSANLAALCDFKGIRVRHNRMSHHTEIDDPEHPGWLIDEQANLQYAHIADLCVEYGMPYGRVPEHMVTLGCRHSYHPMEEYLRQQHWDGRDWFTLVADTVKVRDRDLWHMTLRKWALSACAAVRELTYNRPPRGVLVMQGEQLSGKTSWFRYLAPDRSMFGEGVQLNPAQKDSIKIATKYAIVELGELDATFEKAQIARLKAFISSPYDEVRLPYAHSESNWPRRTVFCGTVNRADFLADQTGNTRFWTSEVESIDLDAMEDISKRGNMGQFWAQINYWLDQGENWWLTRDEAKAIERNNSIYQEVSVYEEMLLETFAWPDEVDDSWGYLVSGGRNMRHLSAVNPMTITEVARVLGLDIGRLAPGYSMRNLRNALEKLTGHTSHLRTYERPWDSVNKVRAPHLYQNRWYYMPYLRKNVPVAKVLQPNFAVVQTAS